MGRRALPKIESDIDLSRHFLLEEQLPNPWDPARIFDTVRPLEVEVGSGKGLFMRNASQANPDHNFMGIEIAYKYARFSGYKLAKSGSNNAVMVHGDGQKIFREILPEACLAAVHVYFPDPWWKARHHRRRLMNEEFSQRIEQVLVPGGRLHFWTDVEDYFDMTVELLQAHTGLEGPLPVPQQEAQHDLDYRTHFERRMRKNEMDIFRSEFVKPEVPRSHQPQL